jgi:hypothetical protein
VADDGLMARIRPRGTGSRACFGGGRIDDQGGQAGRFAGDGQPDIVQAGLVKKAELIQFPRLVDQARGRAEAEAVWNNGGKAARL